MLRVNNICAEYLNTLFTFLSGRIPPSLCPPWEPPCSFREKSSGMLKPTHSSSQGYIISIYTQLCILSNWLLQIIPYRWSIYSMEICKCEKKKKKDFFFFLENQLLNIYQHITANNCCPIFYISLVGSINSGGLLQIWHLLIPWPQPPLTFTSSDTNRKKNLWLSLANWIFA